MADSSLTDRFPLLNRPVAVPGCCMACRKGSVRVFDLRRNFFQHGAAYLCEECIGEMARALNLVPAELVSAAEAEASRPFSEFLAKNDFKVVTNEFYERVMGIVTSIPSWASDSDVLVSAALAASEGEGAGEESPSPVEPDAKPKRKSGKTNAETDRDSSGEGPTSVPVGAGNGADPVFDL